MRYGGIVMLDLAVLPTFLAAALLVIVAPGPDNTFVAAVAVQRGPRAGVLSAAGMALGMVVHVSAAAVGLAVLLRSTPLALNVIRVAGAAYLGWLAVTTLRDARHSGIDSRTPVTDRQVLRRAVLTNLTNPKVVRFFAAFLPQFVRSGHGPVSLQLLTLGLIFLVAGLVSDSLIGLVAGRLGASLAPGSHGATALGVVAGLTFAVLAVVLVLEVLVR
jgi:threonine/homoserine/homoserine lactone efflux protein